ncbi:MAG: hypothetical protein ACI9HK_005796, partial [Pirellulaceae bacterium]
HPRPNSGGNVRDRCGRALVFFVLAWQALNQFCG